MNTKELLARYEELVVKRDLMASKKAELIESVIPQEVRDEIDAIEAEIDPELEELDAAIKAMGDELKRLVAATGEKVVGQRFQVVYVRPRPRWDTKALEGYAAAHPELFAFRKDGKPSAQIRIRK